MSGPRIDTPRGAVVMTKFGKAKLEWSTDFLPKWQTKYSFAQRFCDSEVLRLSEPYTPMQTGMLIKSGQLGTVIGEGKVQWIAPYSKAQYYGKREPGSETGPLRGPMWFERMKAVWGERIIRGVRRLIRKD